jgi:hypothetical protein
VAVPDGELRDTVTDAFEDPHSERLEALAPGCLEALAVENVQNLGGREVARDVVQRRGVLGVERIVGESKGEVALVDLMVVHVEPRRAFSCAIRPEDVDTVEGADLLGIDPFGVVVGDTQALHCCKNAVCVVVRLDVEHPEFAFFGRFVCVSAVVVVGCVHSFGSDCSSGGLVCIW